MERVDGLSVISDRDKVWTRLKVAESKKIENIKSKRIKI